LLTTFQILYYLSIYLEILKQVQDDGTVVQDDGMILNKSPKALLGERFYPPPKVLKLVIASLFVIICSPILLDLPTLKYII